MTECKAHSIVFRAAQCEYILNQIATFHTILSIYPSNVL